MKRRFVASLMFVTAGILLVPAAGTATALQCGWGETQTEPGQSCSAGSTQSTPTSVNEAVDNGSSSIDFEELLKSFTGGIKSGM